MTSHINHQGVTTPRKHHQGVTTPCLHHQEVTTPCIHPHGVTTPHINHQGVTTPRLLHQGVTTPRIHHQGATTPFLSIALNGHFNILISNTIKKKNICLNFLLTEPSFSVRLMKKPEVESIVRLSLFSYLHS